MSCDRTQRLAAELALGIADGAERAHALRHIAECGDCLRAVEELTEVVDGLLMLAPQREPPPGFESRVLARLRPSRTSSQGVRRRRLLAPLAAAAVAAVAAAAVVLGATSDDRRLAHHYRTTLATAHGTDFEAARLLAPGRVPAGVVYGYRGSPSWIFVAVYRPYRSTAFTVELVMASGRQLRLPLRIDPDTGSTGQTIPVDLHLVSRVRLVGATARNVLDAELPRAR
jgi:hypothetical protein